LGNSFKQKKKSKDGAFPAGGDMYDGKSLYLSAF
jgi:hypothetical protein